MRDHFLTLMSDIFYWSMIKALRRPATRNTSSKLLPSHEPPAKICTPRSEMRCDEQRTAQRAISTSP